MMAVGPHPCGDPNRETYLVRTWLERSKIGWLANTRSALVDDVTGTHERLDVAFELANVHLAQLCDSLESHEGLAALALARNSMDRGECL